MNINEHITQEAFDQWFVSPDSLEGKEKMEIEQHLELCSLCREHFELTKRFYQHLQQYAEEPPTERDKAFAEQLTEKKRFLLTTNALERKEGKALDTYFEIIEPYKRPLAQRLVQYVWVHPVKAVSSFSLAAALVIATLMFVRPIKDDNPSYVRAKDEFLVVYNKEGEELWKKHVGIGFDFETFRKLSPKMALNNFMAVEDVDKDGKSEVIVSFGVVDNPLPTGRNTIVCYTFDGRERWKYEFNRQMTFGTEKFSNDYVIRNMMVGEFEKDGTIDIVGVFGHTLYYPWAIIRLDAKNGTLLQEYWNPGECGVIYQWDSDGDGMEELILAGTNNSFDAASFLVLDPSYMSGHAPASPAYSPIGVKNGMEKYCILLPRTDLSKTTIEKRNYVHEIRLTNENLLLIVTTEKGEGEHKPQVLYYFDSQMRCVRVDGSDSFVEAHKQLEAEGKLSKKLNEQYYEDLRKGVQYWDGEKFVQEPTMNKNYLKGMNLQ